MATNKKTYSLTPFVKWAGGKRQLLPKLTERLPRTFNHYFEPFIGGGALYFELQPENATINDINQSLINAYKQIKGSPEDTINSLRKIDDQYENAEDKKAFYYSKREEYNQTLNENSQDSRSAALLIYVNKHCFNGLYRVNSKGAFNVPFNNSTSGSYSEENILAVSNALKNTKIVAGDFEEIALEAKQGDFVFFDSPYAPLNPTSFESYTKQGFSKEDHERLAALFQRLSERGCYCMLTNHNTLFIRELYKDYNVEEVSVRRSINSDATKRRGREVIVRNYE